MSWQLLRRAGPLLAGAAGLLAAGIRAAGRFLERLGSAVMRPIASLAGRARHGLAVGAATLLRAATRLLQPVRRALRAVAGGVTWLTVRVLGGAWHLGARAAAALGQVAAWVFGPARTALTTVARVMARIAAGVLALAWRAVGRVAGVVAVTLAGVVAGTARLVFRAVAAIVTPVARAGRSFLAAALRLATFLGRHLWAPVRFGWRYCLRAGRALVRTVRSATAAVRRGARIVSHAAGWIGRLLVGVASVAISWTGRLLAPVAEPLLRAVGRITTGTGRLVVWVGRRARSAAGFCWSRIGRAASVIGARVRVLAEGVTVAVTGLGRRTVNGAREAAGTARHRANRLADAGPDDGWRLTAYADGQPAEAADVEFSLDVHGNEYLRAGDPTVGAVLSVSCEIHRDAGERPEMVEVILLDCSASMAHPWDKITNARRATQAAVAGLPDGVWFAVVRGSETAGVAYPRRGGLVRASDQTRQEAFKAIAGLQPVGGTAIGRWLRLAKDLVALRPGALGHALLLTDGKDEDESPAELRRAIRECEGTFQCDCRGVGTDWAVEELRGVSDALLGTVDIIREPAGMEADFRQVIEGAMSRGIGASLRVRVPVHATITELHQVSPAIADLTPQGRRVDAQTVVFGLGGWSDETRAYHLTVDVEPGPVGSEMAACRVAVVVGTRTVSSGIVRALWTDDAELAARLDPEVAHYTGQAELAAAVREGLRARREDDTATANARMGRAVQLAARSDNVELLSLLGRVVDVIDADTGTVRVRRDVEAFDEMALDTRSTRTVRTRVRQ